MSRRSNRINRSPACCSLRRGRNAYGALGVVRLRPDFLLRMISYFKQPSRRACAPWGRSCPSYGPLLVASNAASLADWMNLVSVVDRKLTFVWQEPNAGSSDSGLRGWTLRTGMGHELNSTPSERERVIKLVQQQLLKNDLVGVPIMGATAISPTEFQHFIAYQERAESAAIADCGACRGRSPKHCRRRLLACYGKLG